MKIHNLFFLKWKSLVRHPLFEQIILFRFLIGIYIISLLCTIYFGGLFLNRLGSLLFPDEINSLNIYFYFLSFSIFLDFVLKFFLKRPDAQFISIRRFPNTNKSFLIYTIIKEFLSLWNCYLLIFFFPYLTRYLYQEHGLLITVISFAIVFLFQLLISRFVNYIKSKMFSSKSTILENSFFIMSHQGSITNYLLLNIKMTIRTPRLRQQFLSYLIIAIVYIYLINK